MWFDASKGNLVDQLTQRWVRLTGRVVSRARTPWLLGPTGEPTGIGAEFFDRYADTNGLHVLRGQPSGLVPSFEALRSDDFDPGAVSPAVLDFYARTDAFDLDAWSQWTGPFRPFGWALAAIFSRRLQQLNLPLSNLDTSQGMTSVVLPVVEPSTNELTFTAWVRTLVATGHIIYAGAYSTCTVPEGLTPCVRVVFPLPNGNAVVLMRPVAHPDGSLSLISAGNGFGSPGFYFTVHGTGDDMCVRYLRSLRESIHVYESGGQIRADHVLSLWGVTFLRLHYRLRARHVTPISAASPAVAANASGGIPSAGTEHH